MSIQFFRLWPRRPPDGALPLGLSLDDEGLLLAGNCRLIEACLDRDGHLFYRARTASDLSALLTAAYGDPIDATDIHPTVEHIAKLMTERNWSRARIAALHLHLPELADHSAANRILKTDDLLKAINPAAFDPGKHPRWPKGSDEEHGGEFRPADGNSLIPVSDPVSPDDIDGSKKIQAHVHHWHDQAITEKYWEDGLLTKEAYKELKNGQGATTEDIWQDVKDPNLRVHMWDRMHIDATEEVREISSNFLKEKGITKENPMTELQAAELLMRIQSSPTRGISKLRDAIDDYVRTTGDAAAQAKARYLEIGRAFSRGGQTRKRSMVVGSMDAEERATYLRVANRLHDNLLALRLAADRDYWFYLGDLPYRYTVIGFCDRKCLTPAVVIACYKAVAEEDAWGIRLDLIDPATEKLKPFGTVSPRKWTLSSHEKWALDLGMQVDDQMEAAGIGSWRNRLREP